MGPLYKSHAYYHLRLLFPSKKKESGLNEEEKKRADEASRKVAEIRRQTHQTEGGVELGDQNPGFQRDGWIDESTNSTGHDRSSERRTTNRSTSEGWRSN